MRTYGGAEVHMRALLTSVLHGDVLSFTLRPFYLQYPLGRKLCGPQRRSRPDGEERNPSVPGIEARSSSP